MLTLSQIHPIPPYGDATVFEQVLNRTVELGLYLIYDMRSCVDGIRWVPSLPHYFFVFRNYQNLTAVAQQVGAYGSLPNLLLWETAHEPDGNSDPFDAARNTYDLIYEMDGYHPVSIVLNCQVKRHINLLRVLMTNSTLNAGLQLCALRGGCRYRARGRIPCRDKCNLLACVAYRVYIQFWTLRV